MLIIRHTKAIKPECMKKGFEKRCNYEESDFR